MTKATRTFLIHLFGCLAFLSIPVFSSPDFNTGRDMWTIAPFLESFTVYLLLLGFFYSNYYLFLPKLYFSEKKLLFWLVILGCLILVMKLPEVIFPNGFQNMAPPDFAKNSMRKPPGFDFHFFEGGVFQFLFVLFLCFLLKINNRFDEMKIEKQTAEISYLKAQINPHFLFNTLNSLYALTITKSDEAPNAVLKLSSMMRYVVSESAKDFVSLDKEINYIKDYIELQKLRIDKGVSLSFTINGNTTGYVIAPLILIPFIENAFKYGINPDKNSSIKIIIAVEHHHLLLNVQNTIVATAIDEELKTEEGLKNTQKRLNLIYSGNYTLDIKEEPRLYEINLKIDLS